MRRVFMVRYKCKPEQAARNAELLGELFDELHLKQTPGIGYAAFELEDGASFVHLVMTEDDVMLAPIANLVAYQALQEGKAERFEEGPVVTELRELGSFQIFVP